MLFDAIFADGLQSPGPANDFWYEAINTTQTGVRVTAMSALKASACYACVKVLAETIATLPRQIYQLDKNGNSRPAIDHPLQDVIDTRPNDLQTGVEFWEMQVAFGCLFGNSYAEIVPGPRGFCDQLIPLRPDYMRVLKKQNGVGFNFEYTDPFTTKKRIYLPEELLRIPGFSFNGVEGIAPIYFASDPIGLALATEAFGAKFFSKDATPAIVLEHPNQLRPEAVANIKSSWAKAHSGLDNAYSVAVLEEGMKVNPIGVQNTDAQFLETRRYQLAEVARFFRIPLHMINELEGATYSNIEQQGIEFVKYTVRPHIRRIEQRVNNDLILRPDIFTLRHDVDDLLLAEISVRYAAYASGINAGWLTRNEARRKEGLNPIDGLDEPLTPLNLGGDKPMTPEVPNKPPRQAAIAYNGCEPVLVDAFERIVACEVNGLKTLIKKYEGQVLAAKIDDFYTGKHTDYIIKTLKPCEALCESFGIRAPKSSVYAENYAAFRLQNMIECNNINNAAIDAWAASRAISMAAGYVKMESEDVKEEQKEQNL